MSRLPMADFLRIRAHQLVKRHHLEKGDYQDLLQEERLAELRGRTPGDGAMRDYVAAPRGRPFAQFNTEDSEDGAHSTKLEEIAITKAREKARMSTSEESTETMLLNAEYSAEMLANLAKWLDTLAPRQRQVINLRYFEDKNWTEIAAITGTKSGTVNSTLLQSMKKLRKAAGK